LEADANPSAIRATVYVLRSICKFFGINLNQICDAGGGGPRVKCAGKGKMLSQDFIDQMRFYSGANFTAVLEERQLPKGGGGGGINGCGDDERGHLIKSGGTGMAAHMAYNQDGYYVTAASCYIVKKFKEAGGSLAAGGE
jgi:hypothetical protein